LKLSIPADLKRFFIFRIESFHLSGFYAPANVPHAELICLKPKKGVSRWPKKFLDANSPRS
jgi:hypothetical protein